MIVIDKKHYECQTIDFAMPYDTGVDDKDVEEIEKYLDLARELKKVWNMKVTVVLLVAGVLCTPIKALQERLETIGIETKITELQKTFSIHTSRILRRVHEVWDVLLTSFLKKKNISFGRINVRPFNKNTNNNNKNKKKKLQILITQVFQN